MWSYKCNQEQLRATEAELVKLGQAETNDPWSPGATMQSLYVSSDQFPRYSGVLKQFLLTHGALGGQVTSLW